MQCSDFREVADSYLSDELLIETNHDVIAHLEACIDCRRELAARRELRSALRASFADAAELQLNEQFATNLRASLRTIAVGEATSGAPVRRRLMAIAACLLAAAAVALFASRQRQIQTPTETAVTERLEPKVSPLESPSTLPRPADDSLAANIVLNNLSAHAVGDHRDCAIGHRLPERPIDLEEAGRKYDRAYLNLAKVVRSHAHNSSDGFEVVTAHWCVFNGQSFAHIVLRHRGHLASLLVTRLDQADQRSPNGALIGPTNHVIACSTTGLYQVSCFRTLSHAVFVVSDLEEAENLALARSLARPVYDHITRAADIT